MLSVTISLTPPLAATACKRPTRPRSQGRWSSANSTRHFVVTRLWVCLVQPPDRCWSTTCCSLFAAPISLKNCSGSRMFPDTSHAHQSRSIVLWSLSLFVMHTIHTLVILSIVYIFPLGCGLPLLFLLVICYYMTIDCARWTKAAG